jgi:hypothetical protein
VLAGLVPLALLVVLLAATLALTALIRHAILPQGFFAEQWAVVLMIAVGLAVAATVYAIACIRTLLQVRAWQQAGDGARAAGALWALGATALAVLMPLLLVIFLPQHPASS